ncbi:23743_t:CDS:2 [Entrophospora sp. SA101]|nr:23743_t:CDS:2 [Entrophospora sp. SA101]
MNIESKEIGRVATRIVEILRGKDKKNFLPNSDLGDYVVLINAKYVSFTGDKLGKEYYYNHSGYPGGLRERSLKVMLDSHPRELTFRVVKGMMPHTKLGNKQLKRLFIFTEESHNLASQEKNFIKIKATARVYLKEGQGQAHIRTKTGQEKDLKDYFYMEPSLCEDIYQPLKLFSKQNDYDLLIRVKGSGFHSQAEAIRLGIARALLKISPEYKITLKSFSLLTCDARRVERKKVGFKKARKKTQFSKR